MTSVMISIADVVYVLDLMSEHWAVEPTGRSGWACDKVSGGC